MLPQFQTFYLQEIIKAVNQNAWSSFHSLCWYSPHYGMLIYENNDLVTFPPGKILKSVSRYLIMILECSLLVG